MNETRSKLVSLKTSLLNKIHAPCGRFRQEIEKRVIKLTARHKKVLEQQWSEIEQLELEIISEQISSLKASIKRLEEAITAEAEKLAGYENLRSIKGIGARSAGVLLAVIGDVAHACG